MELVFKKIVAPLILTSFLMVAFFGFFAMSYGSDGRMESGCPFSATGASLCPESFLPGVIHHLSAYQSFISVPLNSSILALIIALLAVVYVALSFSFRPLLYRPTASLLYNSPPFTSYDRKIKRWLSLFELSPSR